MKLFIKLSLIVILIGLISCADKKKEEQETKAAIEKVEAIEKELNEVSNDILSKTEELENVLKDLDSI
ncbi:hypothetical protein ACFSTE_10230 [Aquimarina hainanensis]|uniref:Lipoprotein n=1 Tax=Aquimarina hainanensis TaxID=1578017 RepID=A0ABW5N6F0_9FLAO